MAAEAAIGAIHMAAREGDAVSVARMLDEDPRLLSSVWRDDTLLNTAAWNGHVDLVRLLLERGAEVNQAGEDGATALRFAVFRGLEEMVSILLSSGADISRKGYRGRTALMFASSGGHAAVVRLLLRSMGRGGLDERDEDGITALCYACYEGHADVVQVLLLEGADHTIADNNDRTPLQIAEQRKPHECVAVIQVSPPFNEITSCTVITDLMVYCFMMGSAICACVAVVGGRAAACLCPPQGQDATRRHRHTSASACSPCARLPERTGDAWQCVAVCASGGDRSGRGGGGG
jgi:hypothetical protein